MICKYCEKPIVGWSEDIVESHIGELQEWEGGDGLRFGAYQLANAHKECAREWESRVISGKCTYCGKARAVIESIWCVRCYKMTDDEIRFVGYGVVEGAAA